MVDCILAYAATQLVDRMTDASSTDGRDMLDAVRGDARASKQLLVLAHLYARTDAASLALLRRELLRSTYTPAEAAGFAAGTAALALGDCTTHVERGLSRLHKVCVLSVEGGLGAVGWHWPPLDVLRLTFICLCQADC